MRDTGGMTQGEMLLIELAIKESQEEIGLLCARLGDLSNLIPNGRQRVRIPIPLRIEHDGNVVRRLGRCRWGRQSVSRSLVDAQILRQCRRVHEIQVSFPARQSHGCGGGGSVFCGR